MEAVVSILDDELLKLPIEVRPRPVPAPVPVAPPEVVVKFAFWKWIFTMERRGEI
jgi:hypothetical protein